MAVILPNRHTDCQIAPASVTTSSRERPRAERTRHGRSTQRCGPSRRHRPMHRRHGARRHNGRRGARRWDGRPRRSASSPTRVDARQLDERQRQPLPDDRDMSCSEQRQSELFHRRDVGPHLRRVVAGARAVRACDQDHQRAIVLHDAERYGDRLRERDRPRRRPRDPRLPRQPDRRGRSRARERRPGRAAVPSGASTGEHEADELRDGGEPLRRQGRPKAVGNVNGEIADELRGLEALDQRPSTRR